MLFFYVSWPHRSWSLLDAKSPALLFETHLQSDERESKSVPTFRLKNFSGRHNDHYNNFPFKFVIPLPLTKYLIIFFYNCLLLKPYQMRFLILTTLLLSSIGAFAQNSKLK